MKTGRRVMLAGTIKLVGDNSVVIDLDGFKEQRRLALEHLKKFGESPNIVPWLIEIPLEDLKPKDLRPSTGRPCPCRMCIRERDKKIANPLEREEWTHMILCPQCGNKRCPHANNHRNKCTDSNEPEQPQ